MKKKKNELAEAYAKHLMQRIKEQRKQVEKTVVVKGVIGYLAFTVHK